MTSGKVGVYFTLALISLIWIKTAEGQLNPLQLKNPSLAAQNINWNYNMGYGFTPEVNGQITQLGGRWANGITHTVRLYLQSTGAVLATANVTGNGSYNYSTLGASINVTAGVNYVVAVRLNSQSSGCYSNSPDIFMPFSSGAITINSSRYSANTNAMPTTQNTNNMYGMADITFVPCVYAGTISALKTSVIEGDSTTLTAVNNTNSIQWQSSTDGITFTDIAGATGVALNTGAITVKTFYRTRTTNGTCGQDTSNEVTINKIDPFYPLQLQSPSVTSQNLNWNFNMGYRFTATKNGNVTQLGGKWRDGITHTVRLYAYPAGTVLATANVSGSMDWNYASITPVTLTQGNQYVVAVRLNAQSSGTYTTGMSMPVSSAGIQINNATYLSGSNAMPTNSITNAMYGMADIRFEPCEYAGLITGSTTVPKWDSTTLTVVDTIGQIQWQKSTNGTTYSNISGATGNTLNTGSLAQTTWYRTFISNPSCGGDTSSAFKVTVLDPDYPLQLQNPSITGQNLNWNYNMGYRFTANSNGVVSELGGRWSSGVTHTVRLYAYPAGTVLATANVTGNGTWNYTPITSVNLSQGNQYVVAVRLNSQSSGQYGSMSFPATSGQITINNSTYLSGSNAMPTNSITTFMYGMADLKFEPCVFSGTVSANDTLVCSGGLAQLEVLDATGSIQWQSSSNGVVYTNIIGANDTTYTTPNITSPMYYRCYTSAACGGDTSNAVLVNVVGGGKTGLWTGAENNQWSNACNWASGAVPSNGDSVFIPFGTSIPTGNPSISLAYLEIDNAGNFVLSNPITITGALHLKTGNISLGSYNLNLGASAQFIGGLSTSYIDASGTGEIRKHFSASGSSVTVPLGGNSQFTPISFTLNLGSIPGTGAYISFRSIDMNHPSLGTPANRISRYWIIGGSNISLLNYDVTCTYANVDVIGTESSIVTRFLNSSSVWSSHSNANATNNTLSATGLTSYGEITGGDDLPFQSVQSGNWNSTSTWSGGVVPSGSNDVSILNGHTVTLTATANARSVSIHSGGTLNLLGNQLNVGGNFVNNGNFDQTGTVHMNGSAAQQITGTTTFDVLRINNSNGVSCIGASTSIITRLEVVSGNFHTGNDLTLISNSTKTASIGQVTGSIAGSVSAQRNISGTTALEWRHLSSPVANSSLSDIQYHATNNPGGIYMFGFSGSNYPAYSSANVQFHSEAAAASAGNWSAGYINASTVSQNFSHSAPITFYTGGSSFPNLNLEVTGNPNVGTYSLNNLSLTGSNASTGWHFIGNPYPSSINWSSVSLLGVDATAYIWTNGGWTASTLFSNEISSFQGFFVHVNNASNSITFNENDKINSDAPYRKSTAKRDRLKFSLTNISNKRTTLSAIDFNPTSTYGFDTQFDAYIVGSGNSFGVPLWGVKDHGIEYQVYTIPGTKSNQTLPIVFDPSGGKNFVLKIKEYPSSPVCITLHDKSTGKVISILTDSVYSFTSNGAQDSNRFELWVTNPLSEFHSKNSTCFGKNDGEIILGRHQNPLFSIYDQNGSAMPITFSQNLLKASHLKPGIYHVIYDSTPSCPAINQWVSIIEPPQIIPEYQILEDVSHPHIVKFDNQTQFASKFKWYFGNGDSSTIQSPVYEYRKAGKYNIRLIAQEGVCTATLEREYEVAPFLSENTETNSSNFRLQSENEGVFLYLDDEWNNTQVSVYSLSGKLLSNEVNKRFNRGRNIVYTGPKTNTPLVIAVGNSSGVQTHIKIIH